MIIPNLTMLKLFTFFVASVKLSKEALLTQHGLHCRVSSPKAPVQLPWLDGVSARVDGLAEAKSRLFVEDIPCLGKGIKGISIQNLCVNVNEVCSGVCGAWKQVGRQAGEVC